MDTKSLNQNGIKTHLNFKTIKLKVDKGKDEFEESDESDNYILFTTIEPKDFDIRSFEICFNEGRYVKIGDIHKVSDTCNLKDNTLSIYSTNKLLIISIIHCESPSSPNKPKRIKSKENIDKLDNLTSLFNCMEVSNNI